MEPDAEMSELVELRSYRLVPGRAEAFVAHFEAHFLASQEALGMDIVGQFTVPGDDARFVWVRRYREPPKRGEALTRFYTGPVWERFGPRANEMMIDFSDVHLLVPHRSMPGFAAGHVPHARSSDGRGDRSGDVRSTVIAAVFELGGPGELPPAAVDSMTSAAQDEGVCELGRLVTADVVNDFPPLPVHEGVSVAVWLLSDRSGGRAATVAAETVATSHGLPLHTTALTPTARSTLR
jgi:hypothetical protein